MKIKVYEICALKNKQIKRNLKKKKEIISDLAVWGLFLAGLSVGIHFCDFLPVTASSVLGWRS